MEDLEFRVAPTERTKNTSYEKQKGFCLPERDAGDEESLLKGQCTKFHFQTLILGSGRRRAEWTRDD